MAAILHFFEYSIVSSAGKQAGTSATNSATHLRNRDRIIFVRNLPTP